MASNNGRRKTQAEVKAYKNAVKVLSAPIDGTYDVPNMNLEGSNEVRDRDFPADTPEVPQIPWRLRAKRFLKKNTYEVVVGVVVGVLAALVAWYGATLIDLKIDSAVLESRLNDVDKQIEDLDADAVTHELLDLQLDALKNDISHDHDLDLIELERRIDLLEQQITLVRESLR